MHVVPNGGAPTGIPAPKTVAEHLTDAERSLWAALEDLRDAAARVNRTSETELRIRYCCGSANDAFNSIRALRLSLDGQR